MNGRLFEGPLLDWLLVGDNECMPGFNIARGDEQIKALRRKVTENCSFTETGEQVFEKLFDLDCGTVPYATGFIIGGEQSKPGQWPFVVALLAYTRRQFFCGGSIISKHHVLTAAHCIKEKYSKVSLSSHDITVFLGHHSLLETSVARDDLRSVLSIAIHPDWNSTDLKYDADIAVLRLNVTIAFTNFIQPACLTMDPEVVKKEDGYVVSSL